MITSRSRATALLIVFLLAFAALVIAQKPPAKPPARPPAKPGAAQPQPKEDAAKATYERAKATLQKIIKDIDAQKTFLVEQVGTVDGIASPYQFTEAQASNYFASEALVNAPKLLAELEKDYQSNRKGTLDSIGFHRSAYTKIQDAVRAHWSLNRGVVQVAARKLDAENTRDCTAIRNEVDAKKYKIRTSYDTEFPKIVQELSDRCQGQAEQISSRAKELGTKLSKARNRWCAELWAWHDYTQKRRAVKDDVHDSGRFAFAYLIGSLFASKVEPKPLPEFPKVGSPADELARLLPVIGSGVGTNIYEAGESGRPGDYKPFAWAKGNPIFDSNSGGISYGPIFEPSTDQLKVYVEVSSAITIGDAVLIPELADLEGRIRPKKFEGSDSYTLFTYGPRLPKNKGELKLSGPPKGFLYDVLAFQEDFDQKRLSPELKKLWDQGQGLARHGYKGDALRQLVEMPGMLVRVRLAPNVLAGTKKFTVNGASVNWFLDQGTEKAQIGFMRDLNEFPTVEPTYGTNVEETKFAYRGERVFIEVRTPVAADWSDVPKEYGGGPSPFVYVVVGRNGASAVFDGKAVIKATQVPGSPTLYRTQNIELVPTGDPRIELQNNAPDRIEKLLYLGLDPGDSIHAVYADPRQFLTDGGGASLQVAPNELESLWVSGLRRAAKVAGLEGNQNWATISDREVQRVTNVILTQVYFKVENATPPGKAFLFLLERLYGVRNIERGDVQVSNRITLGNHAAMILLRDQFITMMKPLAELLDGQDTPDKQLAYMASLGPAMKDPSFVPGRIIKVNGPNSPDVGGGFRTDFHPIRRFYTEPEWLSAFIPSQPERDRVLRSAFLDGFAKYRQSVKDALKKAEDTEDKDIQGLLTLTGSGFGNVVDALVPKLVKLSPNSAVPGAFAWVPDRYARGEVRGIDDTFDAIQAQREYSAADTNVALAAASLVPFALPVGLLRTTLALGINLTQAAVLVSDQLPRYSQEEKEYQFAIGASTILGHERFYMAQQQRTAVWSIALNLLLAAVGIKPDVKDFIGAISKIRALARGSSVAADVLKDGAQALLKANAEDQAALINAAAAVEAKTVLQGANSLTAQERQIAEAWKKIAAATDESRTVTKVLPELDITTPMAPPKPVDLSPVPAGLPPMSGGGKFVAANGKLFNIVSDVLGGGAYFKAWFLDGTKSVIKLLYKADPTERILTWQGIRHASDVLRHEKIPWLAVEEIFDNLSNVKDPKQLGYYIQQALVINKDPNSGKAIFFVSDWVGKNGLAGKLSDGMENAVIDLMYSMYKKGIGWEDCKFDNMFLRQVGPDNWIAGVSDPDRIGYWGELPMGMNGILKDIEAGGEHFGYISPDGFAGNLRSIVGKAQHAGQTRALSCGDFWRVMFERKGWLTFDGQRFVDRTLSAKKVFERFKELNKEGVIDLSKAPPLVVKPPAGVPALPPLKPKAQPPLGQELWSRLRLEWERSLQGLADALGPHPAVAAFA